MLKYDLNCLYNTNLLPKARLLNNYRNVSNILYQFFSSERKCFLISCCKFLSGPHEKFLV